jgi:hypothetical protein
LRPAATPSPAPSPAALGIAPPRRTAKGTSPIRPLGASAPSEHTDVIQLERSERTATDIAIEVDPTVQHLAIGDRTQLGVTPAKSR